jgi:signal transduction histidine kinase
MGNNLPEFAAKYTAALEDYLGHGGEIALRNAYELGRQGLSLEAGLFIITEVHHNALYQALQRTDPKHSEQIIKQAAQFLSECLSPFEMAQRGFQESISVLNNLNKALHRQEKDLHLLLSPIPNLLLTIDDEDRLVAFFVPPNFPNILNECKVGIALDEILPDEIYAQITLALPHVRDSKHVNRLECPLLVSGHTLYFDLQISPVNDSHEVLLVMDDITERKEIQLAEHRQRIFAEALRDTAIALNSSLDLNEILNRIVSNMGRVVPYDTANIMLFDGDIARIVRSFGYTDHALRDYEKLILNLPVLHHTTPSLYKVRESKQPLIASNLNIKTESHEYLGLGVKGSAVSAPIMITDSVIGFINLNSFKPDFFTSTHAENLQIFANQAAVAIHNARLFEQAHEAAALEERQRLARDLHDSVSQSLFSASIIAETLPTLFAQNPTRVVTLLADLRTLIKGITAEMRILLWEMRPANLVTTSLDKLLAQLVEAASGRTKIDISLKVDTFEQLPESIHIVFYRIAQEALNNIVKHSHATKATLHLYMKEQSVILHIHDNGRGFSQEQISSGFGLDNMQERAEMVGASYVVESKLGQGTEITFVWKVSQIS